MKYQTDVQAPRTQQSAASVVYETRSMDYTNITGQRQANRSNGVAHSGSSKPPRLVVQPEPDVGLQSQSRPDHCYSYQPTEAFVYVCPPRLPDYSIGDHQQHQNELVQLRRRQFTSANARAQSVGGVPGDKASLINNRCSFVSTSACLPKDAQRLSYYSPSPSRHSNHFSPNRSPECPDSGPTSPRNYYQRYDEVCAPSPLPTTKFDHCLRNSAIRGRRPCRSVSRSNNRRSLCLEQPSVERLNLYRYNLWHYYEQERHQNYQFQPQYAPQHTLHPLYRQAVPTVVAKQRRPRPKSSATPPTKHDTIGDTEHGNASDVMTITSGSTNQSGAGMSTNNANHSNGKGFSRQRSICQDDNSIVWRNRGANCSAQQNGYEMSDELLEQQVIALLRKYGHPARVQRAAIIIQKAYRNYRIAKRFSALKSSRSSRIGTSGSSSVPNSARSSRGHASSSSGRKITDQPSNTALSAVNSGLVSARYESRYAGLAPPTHLQLNQSQAVNRRSKSTERYSRSHRLCQPPPPPPPPGPAETPCSPQKQVQAVRPFKILSDEREILGVDYMSDEPHFDSCSHQNGKANSTAHSTPGPTPMMRPMSPAPGDCAVGFPSSDGNEFPTYVSNSSLGRDKALPVPQANRLASTERYSSIVHPRLVIKPSNERGQGAPRAYAQASSATRKSSSGARLKSPGLQHHNPVWVRKACDGTVTGGYVPTVRAIRPGDPYYATTPESSTNPSITPSSESSSGISSHKSSNAQNYSLDTPDTPSSSTLSKSLPESSFLAAGLQYSVNYDQQYQDGRSEVAYSPVAYAHPASPGMQSPSSSNYAEIAVHQKLTKVRVPNQRGVSPAAVRVAEIERKRRFRIGLNFFNKKPERGIELLMQYGFVEPTPQAVAKFLMGRRGLSKLKIGEYLGNIRQPFNMAVLDCFANEINYTGKEIDSALRDFLKVFRLPGECQKIEKIIEVFAQRYAESNPERMAQFHNPDTIFVLSYAIIMLNVDLHSPSLKPEKRMKLEDFIKNLSDVDQGNDIDRAYLTGIYERMKEKEFKEGHDHVTQVTSVDRSVIGPKKPQLILPSRRLVCYCRLYEVIDQHKKQSSNAHQREIFLFNDLIFITKIMSRKKNVVTYSYRQSHQLGSMVATPFQNQYYNFGIQVATVKVANETPKMFCFNARSLEDRDRFMEDLNESIHETNLMTNLVHQMELSRIKKNNNGFQHLFENKFEHIHSTSYTNFGPPGQLTLNTASPRTSAGRTHSLGRNVNENRDSGLADDAMDSPGSAANVPVISMPQNPAAIAKAKVRHSGAHRSSHKQSSGANAAPVSTQRKSGRTLASGEEELDRRSSLNSLDSGMSSTASTASHDSASPQDKEQQRTDSQTAYNMTSSKTSSSISEVATPTSQSSATFFGGLFVKRHKSKNSLANATSSEAIIANESTTPTVWTTEGGFEPSQPPPGTSEV